MCVCVSIYVCVYIHPSQGCLKNVWPPPCGLTSVNPVSSHMWSLVASVSTLFWPIPWPRVPHDVRITLHQAAPQPNTRQVGVT